MEDLFVIADEDWPLLFQASPDAAWCGVMGHKEGLSNCQAVAVDRDVRQRQLGLQCRLALTHRQHSRRVGSQSPGRGRLSTSRTSLRCSARLKLPCAPLEMQMGQGQRQVVPEDRGASPRTALLFFHRLGRYVPGTVQALRHPREGSRQQLCLGLWQMVRSNTCSSGRNAFCVNSDSTTINEHTLSHSAPGDKDTSHRLQAGC